MHKHYYFRDNELNKWLHIYRQAKYFIKWYRNYTTSISRIELQDEANEANRIIYQHKVILCSLDEESRIAFENLCKGTPFCKVNYQIFRKINEVWNEVVNENEKNKIKNLDIAKFGLKIKEIRTKLGITRAEAAFHLGIDESTLKTYENGTRVMNINTLYKIIQLYFLDDLKKLSKFSK